jgi:hypothetical protein
MKEIFEKIIKERVWTSKLDLESPCGPGSSMEYTKNLRSQLGPFLLKHNIKSMFDAPCGDYSWINQTKLPEDLKYIGGDIVDFLILENQQKYPGVEFIQFNLVSDSMPDVDLLFCRDCLLHLTLADIDKVFENFCRSNIKYILTSNWLEKTKNHNDIKTGKHRFINFLEDPYNFNQPIDFLIDYIPRHTKRHLMLWDKKTIQNYLENRL